MASSEHKSEWDLKEVAGDASKPPPPTNPATLTIIAHVTNDIRKWGRGFVVSLSDRFPGIRAAFIAHPDSATLGYVTWFKPEDAPNTLVANMTAQRGIRRSYSSSCPLQYKMLRACLENVASKVKMIQSEDRPVRVFMPKIGAGLAGGDWAKIRPIICKTLHGLDVTVVTTYVPS